MHKRGAEGAQNHNLHTKEVLFTEPLLLQPQNRPRAWIMFYEAGLLV